MCFPNSRNRTNLTCYVLRVQACQSCVNLDRTGHHEVDAGFWVVLELIIRWIGFLIRSDRFIIFGNVCSFFMDPDLVVQPYSVMLSQVKRVYRLCLKKRVLLAFHI
jgi:hypothetical protein